MKVIETNLKDCYIIEEDLFEDDRGYFTEFYSDKKFMDNNINNVFAKVVQCNRSKSSKGTLRGMHFQKGEYAQAKLVECLRGAVLDVVVDMRKDSSSFKKWTSVLLTEDNHRQLLVPRGFAHGFLTLKDDTIFQYLVDNLYNPESEDGFKYNDEEIGINWEFDKYDIDNLILSDKDRNRKSFSEVVK